MSATSTRDLVERILSLPRPILVALDVDGTLSPIVRNPDMARIPEPTLDALAGLSAIDDVVIALVTGRDLGSLGGMERLEGIWRAVEHGGVVLAPGEQPAERTLTDQQRDALDRFRKWTADGAADAFVEYKPQAVAIHVRRIAERDPGRAEQLLAEADALAKQLGLHVRRGRALREAEAVPSDKGAAVAEILRRSGAASVLFAGDDVTDFPAIELAASHGIGVFVRSNERRVSPTEGAVVVDGVEQMASVLGDLRERLAR